MEFYARCRKKKLLWKFLKQVKQASSRKADNKCDPISAWEADSRSAEVLYTLNYHDLVLSDGI